METVCLSFYRPRCLADFRILMCLFWVSQVARPFSALLPPPVFGQNSTEEIRDPLARNRR